MADIALLVAEEFEKRTKRGAPVGGGGDDASKGTKNFGAVTKVFGSWAESAAAAAAASGVKVRVALLVRAEMMESKTGLGLAAVDGFFSA